MKYFSCVKSKLCIQIGPNSSCNNEITPPMHPPNDLAGWARNRNFHFLGLIHCEIQGSLYSNRWLQTLKFVQRFWLPMSTLSAYLGPTNTSHDLGPASKDGQYSQDQYWEDEKQKTRPDSPHGTPFVICCLTNKKLNHCPVHDLLSKTWRDFVILSKTLKNKGFWTFW